MAYIGNTVQNQGFTPAIDYFNGNGVTVTFTLSRPVVSVAQMIVAIDNVIQNPSTAFTVSGNSITFTSAPLSGTNNIWVEYTSLITQYNAISQDPSVIGDITASGGYLATGDFGNTFTDGTIVDYVTGMSRITTGSATGMTFYNGGPSARNALMALTSAGNVGVGTISPSAKLQVAANNGGIATTAGSGTQAQIQMAGNGTTLGTSSFDLLQGASSEAYVYNRANTALIFGTNNTERMRINANGQVTMPAQPVFASTGSGNQNWSGAAAYQVLQTSLSNTDIPSARRAGYNTSNYRFTAPVAGVYVFYCSFTITNTSTGPEAYFFINGNPVRFVAIGYMYTGGFFTSSASAAIYLNASDFIDVRIINNNSTTFTVDLGRSSFGGYLLG